MFKRRMFVFILVLLIAVLALSACDKETEAPKPTEVPPAEETAPEAEVEEAGLPDLGGREITIAMENAYLPFNYIELDTGEPGGWDYVVWDELCVRLNCAPVYV